MSRFELHPIGSPLDTVLGAEELERNRARMADLDDALAAKVDETHAGWGAKYVERVHAKGKLTAWERIALLRDEDSEVFEVGTLVNWGVAFEGSRRGAPGAGVITCFARVADRWVIVIANDNTVASGAWWPRTPEKIQRAQQMALAMRLPVVYLVDCSGLFLPEQSRSFSGRTGAGHIFRENARLADAGVPQIAGVFGDCIAGGGYMPIISDHVVMTESAYMVIAGAALIKGAKALDLTSLDIGGPEVHVHQGRCADERVPDDPVAVRLIREKVSQLPGTATEFYRYGAEPAPPTYPPEDLSALFPGDFRQTYAIEDVLGRLVDSSLFHEVFRHLGREMITGVGRVGGLWAGFIANRQGLCEESGVGRRPGGVLYREGIAKISAFVRACSDDGLPIVWLQDISGFDIGVEAERLGLLGYGSNLIYANSTTRTPVFTILLRKASGAGYYAMSGMPYEPVVQLSTPLTRLSVMEGRTLAIATYNSKLDENFEIASTDPEERAAIERGMREVAERIDADMDPVGAASRMDTDEIVPTRRLRAWLECLVEAAWQSTGYRRTKNPRIWSLHDLEVIAPTGSSADPVVDALSVDGVVAAPTLGLWTPVISMGATVRPGEVVGTLYQHGRLRKVMAPCGAVGAAAVVTPASRVEFGDALVVLGEAGVVEPLEDNPASGNPDVPPGVTVVSADTDGTFYLRAEPHADAFAPVGSRVEHRATLGLVEVMKTFNPIRSPSVGVVLAVLAEDAEGVEAGQPLFWLRNDES